MPMVEVSNGGSTYKVTIRLNESMRIVGGDGKGSSSTSAVFQINEDGATLVSGNTSTSHQRSGWESSASISITGVETI